MQPDQDRANAPRREHDEPALTAAFLGELHGGLRPRPSKQTDRPDCGQPATRRRARTVDNRPAVGRGEPPIIPQCAPGCNRDLMSRPRRPRAHVHKGRRISAQLAPSRGHSPR
jgi:hypothetical protein